MIEQPELPSSSAASTRKEAAAEAKAAKARAKSLRPWYRKKRSWLGGIVALIVIIVIINSASGSRATNASKTNPGHSVTGPVSPPPPSKAYAIGQSAPSGGYNFVVFGVSDPYGVTMAAFAAPAGQHFVVADVQVTNPDNKAHFFSSAIAFHLVDTQNHQYEETIVAGLSPTAPEGEIAAGQSIRGFVAFQVPDGTVTTSMRLQGGLTAAGAVVRLH